ncbi:redox-regulated ATPase YchF [Metallumcola ferriviriculae]|uniref:Ribosome-binding ATPase YchF n=1 Tax=Metallumcola ferriviriculae TaxID=3039180 RepID=A0AAU0UIA1_9FIRM|nr:redox-regulated ATPase YchF [Desulfitibacteraceae bacterium MK1]
MSLSVGIIGLPNVGKSTLFNALTKQQAETANYPFCTIDPNIGIVAVPDERLEQLADMLGRERKIPSTVKFVDIAGLVKGASSGEGLGNQFLAHIREVDMLVHVVRCFQESDVTHVTGNVNPLEDISIIETELALADIETVVRRKEKVEKLIKAKEKGAQKEKELLNKVEEILNAGGLVREEMDGEQMALLAELNLLTAKPIIYAANISEEQLLSDTNDVLADLETYAGKKGVAAAPISAQLEAEVAELDDIERQEFLKDFGLDSSGLHRLIKSVYRLLGLNTFFTYNETEVRAWEISVGTPVPQAAGKIHKDMETGFIRADVINWQLLLDCGDFVAARQKGLLKSEGKEYELADGDVVYIHFRS